MAEFNWVTALMGGVLIGISSTILLAFNLVRVRFPAPGMLRLW